METGAELTTHMVLSALVVYAIEWMKRWQVVPWIDANTKSVNWAVSAVLALVTSIGITYSFDAEAGRLVIDGLTWATITTTGWEALKQFVNQQLVYAMAVEARPVKIITDEKR